jgi:hypothetical protein
MLDQLNQVHVPQDNLTPIIYDMIFVLFGAKQMKMEIFYFAYFVVILLFILSLNGEKSGKRKMSNFRVAKEKWAKLSVKNNFPPKI